MIETVRPLAIELTRWMGYPVGIGVLDGDAVALRFWTGTISPLAHTNTVLGLRPDLVTTAMGPAYLAFCPEEERDRLLARLRRDKASGFSGGNEALLLQVLCPVRENSYALGDSQIQPLRATVDRMEKTIAVMRSAQVVPCRSMLG